MAGYRLSAAILNRKKVPGKVSDGLALSFIRNKDGSLTAWQRVKRDGKTSDIKVVTVAGEIDQAWLQEARAKAFALKGRETAAVQVVTFRQAWDDYYEAVTTAVNSK